MNKTQEEFEEAEELIQFLQPNRLARLERVLSQRTSSLTVVLDGVNNYHNISAVIRSADAFGLSSVHLVGASFEISPGITLGTERWMIIKRHKSAAESLESLRKEGFKIVVTAPEEATAYSNIPALPVYKLPFQEKLALIFGNEKRGVSQEFSKAAELRTYIPMFGFVESFNISVACAICLFCSSIGDTNGKRALPSLDEKDATELKNYWLKQGVKRSDTILKEIGRRKR